VDHRNDLLGSEFCKGADGAETRPDTGDRSSTIRPAKAAAHKCGLGRGTRMPGQGAVCGNAIQCVGGSTSSPVALLNHVPPARTAIVHSPRRGE
jgi:hypothetical protein